MGRYVVVSWPDSQDLMDKEGFGENSYLVNDEKGIEDFGSSAYFVDEEWLNEIESKESGADWSKVKEAILDAHNALELMDDKKFKESIKLSDEDIAIGFYVDEYSDGEPLLWVLLNDDSMEDILDLSLEDAERVAEKISMGDYD